MARYVSIRRVIASQWFEPGDHPNVKVAKGMWRPGQAYIDRPDGMQLMVHPGCWIVEDEDRDVIDVYTDAAFKAQFEEVR
jgi:hypothetical protein